MAFNSVSNNLTSLPTPPKEQPKPEKVLEENFVDKFVRIVKQRDNREQMVRDLLIANSSQGLSEEQCKEIILRVKKDASTDPSLTETMYCCLREALTVGLEPFEKMRFQIASAIDISQFDEDFRIACAKLDCSSTPGFFCENFKNKKYGHISDVNKRKELLNMLREDDQSAFIDLFDLDEDMRKEKAFALLDGNYLSSLIENVDKFKLKDADVLLIAEKLIQKGRTELLAENIEKYGEANTKKIATMLFQHAPVALFKNIDRFGLTDESFITAIAQKALKENPALAAKIADLGLKEFKNIISLMACVCQTPENFKYFEFFYEDQANRAQIALQCPELAYWVFQDNPEEIYEWVCSHHSSIPSTLFASYQEIYKDMQEETGPAKKAAKVQHFILRSIALTYAEQSPELASAMTALIADLQKPHPKKDNPRVREQQNLWLAQFLLQCRMANISYTQILQHMPLITSALHIKAPFLRTQLQDNFIEFLTNPEALKKYTDCQKRILELAKQSKISLPKGKKLSESQKQQYVLEQQQNLAAKREEKFRALLMMLAPYLSQEAMLKFTDILFKNKNFEDDVRMKELLSKLQLILKAPHLTRKEKEQILEKLILVDDKGLAAKKQVETIITSAELVVQYIEFGELDLLKRLTTPQELRDNRKKMFVEQLGLKVGQDFDARYEETFLKARKANALLTYAANMKTLPEQQAKGVCNLIHTFAESILTKTINTVRNSRDRSKHIDTLERVAPGALAEFNKEFSFGDVRFTNSPWLLFLAGYDANTCQSFASTDTTWARGMIGTVMKGEVIQLIKTKKVINKEGREEEIVIAKRSMRLLLDKDTQKPVLYQGDTLPWDDESGTISQEFDAACIAFSDKLSKALGYSVPLLGNADRTSYPGTVVCLPCEDVEFEYVEGTVEELSCHSIVQGGKGYTLKPNSAAIIHAPKV